MPFFKDSGLWPSNFPQTPRMGWPASVSTQQTSAAMDGGTTRVRQIALDFPQEYTLTFNVAGSALLEEMLQWLNERTEFFFRFYSGVSYYSAPGAGPRKQGTHVLRLIESPATTKVGYQQYQLRLRVYCKSIDQSDEPVPL